jgi:hypothetical protein
MLSVLIFGGTLTGNIYGGLFGSLGVIVVFGVASFIPAFSRFNPLSLASGTFALLVEAAQPSDSIPAIFICIALISALIVGTIVLFNKKKV